MSRKNIKARKLKRNKKVRNARRSAKSKWKFVTPLIIAMSLLAVTYYKIALTYEYTATATLYDKMDRVHIITEECVTSSSENAARIRTTLLKNVLYISSKEVKEVSIREGCDFDSHKT